MTKLVNRAKMTTATTGTGTITLGSAVDGYQSYADAGVSNGDVLRSVIEDGSDWEISTGTYTATGTTLSRTLVESSTGSLLNLSGNAVVYVIAAAQDIQQPPAEGAFVDGDKTKLDGIEAGATADQTASEILTAIKTVDGTGSGLDADLLDGNDSSAFYLATNPDGYTTNTGTVTSVAASVPTGFSLSGSPITTSGTLGITYAAGYQGYTTTEASKLAGIETGADVTDAGNVNPLVDTHLNTSSATTGQYLGWNGADYAWSTVSGYTDADVDTHLNTGTATTGEVLSWTGSDYDWVDAVTQAEFNPYITQSTLSGTTPSVNVSTNDTYTLTTSGNTTFTFTGAPSSGQVGTVSLIITAGGAHTLTWPASVDWAGGSAPAAPASGETDIYTFMTINGGTTWYGFLAGDAMA